MTDSRSTLDDEVDDEPIPDGREDCFFWDSRAGLCRFESLIPGSEPCAGCPASAGDDPRHIAVSVYGWNCDVCGRPVDGRTDERGVSCREDGMPVRHVEEDPDEAAQRADDKAWADARGE